MGNICVFVNTNVMGNTTNPTKKIDEKIWEQLKTGFRS